MHLDIYGNIRKPAVVLVGSWDPLIQNYFYVIEQANAYCSKMDYQLLLILLDPLPSNVVLNRVSPIFDCCDIRIKYLCNVCSGAVCKVAMTKDVLDGGVQQFLPGLNSKFQIAELWLRERQTLGSGPQNSIRDIEKLCRTLNLVFKIMPADKALVDLTNKVKFSLQNGQIATAIELVGHSPLWTKNENLYIPIGWKTGTYEYRTALFTAKSEIILENEFGLLEIFQDENEHAVFMWPNKNIELISISEIHLPI